MTLDQKPPMKLAAQLKTARCPRCGDTAPLSRFDICVPCTASEGFDPKCAACLTDQAGGDSTGMAHVDTCQATTSSLTARIMARLAHNTRYDTDTQTAARSAHTIAAKLGAPADEVAAALARLAAEGRVRQVGQTQIDGPTWAMARPEEAP